MRERWLWYYNYTAYSLQSIGSWPTISIVLVYTDGLNEDKLNYQCFSVLGSVFALTIISSIIYGIYNFLNDKYFFSFSEYDWFLC